MLRRSRHNFGMLLRAPASYKVVAGLCGLLGVLEIARWLSDDAYVRGPFFWIVLAVKAIAVALSVKALLEGIRRYRREPVRGEMADDPRRRQLQSAMGIGFVAILLLSSVVYMFAATDGDDPYTTDPLDLAAYTTTGAILILLIAMLVWMSVTSMRR